MTRAPRREIDAVEQLVGYIEHLMSENIARYHRELENFAATLDPDSFSANSAAWKIRKDCMRSFVDQLGSSRERAKAKANLRRLSRRNAQVVARKEKERKQARLLKIKQDNSVAAWDGIRKALTETYRVFPLIDQATLDDRGRRRQQLLEKTFIQSRDGISVFTSACPKQDPFRFVEIISGNSNMGGADITQVTELWTALSQDSAQRSRFLQQEEDFLRRNHYVSPELIPRIRDSMKEALASDAPNIEALSAKWPSALRRLRSRSKPPPPAVTWLRVYCLYKALQGALIFFQPVIPDWEPPESSNTIRDAWGILLIMIGSEILIRAVDE
jgi:hypothetical protein